MKYQSCTLSKIDLSHNESVRLATDALLDRGLLAYEKVLVSEGEVDFLSQAEKEYILRNTTEPPGVGESPAEEVQGVTAPSVDTSVTYFPDISESEAPALDYGWPMEERSYYLQGRPRVEVYFQTDRSRNIKDLLREYINKATMVLAIVMDVFSDTEIFCDILEATKKRNVFVYLLLDHTHLSLFSEMCEKLQINSSHLTKMSIRSVCGETYCSKSGKKFSGQIKENFVIIDCTHVLVGSYSFTWLSGQVHRNLAVLFKGSSVKPFDLEFRQLYAMSKPLSAFPCSGSQAHYSTGEMPLSTTQKPSVTSQSNPSVTLSGCSSPAPQYTPATGVTGWFSDPKPPITPPHAAKGHKQTYQASPRAHWLPQMHNFTPPTARQRSYSSDYATGNTTRPYLNNMFGMKSGRPSNHTPRLTSGFHYLNKPDLIPP
ncbi:FA83A protein, partial [Amia calva]|nr:FA83A protein [Amia calva]